MKKILLICSLLVSFPSFAFEETLTFSELGVDKIFESSPVDDPGAYHVEAGDYSVKASPFHWVVPGPGSFREEIIAQKSNHNVAIEFYQNRLFMAFRTGPTHLSKKKTRMYVISSGDGINWELEWKSEGGKNPGEPQLLNYKGQLHFYFYSGASGQAYKISRSSIRNWSTPEPILSRGEVPWEMKIRNNLMWVTSYSGKQNRVRGGAARIKVHLKQSTDGKNFNFQDSAKEAAYIGGASETGFEFDEEGHLWGVTRNDGGDESGFGAHLVFAPSYLMSYWSMQASSESYQSPRMFRHGKDLYLLARRHKGAKPYNWARRGDYGRRRILNWLRFSLTPKTTSLFKLNQEKRQLELIMDLPGAGDTAFPSVRRVDKDTFLVANYTSALHRQNRRWIVGALSRTKIYLIALKFEKKVPKD